MMSFLKGGGDSQARKRLRDQLVAERLCGVAEPDTFLSEDMKRGVEREAAGLMRFEVHSGLMFMPCGFLEHETLAAGVSPDGQANDFSQLIELKCPKAATHSSYLRGLVPEEYYWQCVHGLFIVSQAEVCHFVSYHPAFHDDLKLCHRTLHREDADLAAYEAAVVTFLASVDEATRAAPWPLRQRMEPPK